MSVTGESVQKESPRKSKICLKTARTLLLDGFLIKERHANGKTCKRSDDANHHAKI